MTDTAFLARLCTWELDTTGSGNWVAIHGIRDGSHSPKTTMADGATDQDNGRDWAIVASRGDEFSVKGKRIENLDTGARDAGQEAAEAWAVGIGADSLKPFRITTPGGTVYSFDATAEVTLFGGGLNDTSDWELKITVAGDITATAP